jgi:hypothetical protein
MMGPDLRHVIHKFPERLLQEMQCDDACGTTSGRKKAYGGGCECESLIIMMYQESVVGFSLPRAAFRTQQPTATRKGTHPHVPLCLALCGLSEGSDKVFRFEELIFAS